VSGSAGDGVRLRRMRWWDVPALVPVDRDCFGSDAWEEAGFWSELAGWPESRHYVVAEPADGPGTVLGYAGLSAVVDEATVQTVAVDPAHRGQGLGRLLVDALLAEAEARGARTVWLEVRDDNTSALALYGAYGFRRAGVRRGYYAGGRVDAVVMRRRAAEAGQRRRSTDPSRGYGQPPRTGQEGDA
jgi:[ribosomal protein S18]-alanine N-acetyltransferase